MPSLKDIRKRIASVKNTQKITRAMKLVSAAKLRRAQEAMSQLRPYADKHRELLGSLVSQIGLDSAPHRLLERRPEVKRVAVLALSSDRGMCGGYNSYLQKAVKRYVDQRAGEGVPVTVFTLGRRVGLFARKQDFDAVVDQGEIIETVASGRIGTVTKTLVDGFLAGEFDEVVIIFNRFQSALVQVPTVQPLLPVVPAEAAKEVPGGASGAPGTGGTGDLLYEPDQVSLLAYVVPRYVEVQVRSSILESIAGEHAARMNAMNSATDNAADMISSLTLQMNRARQAAITKELMEIIGGAEALK